MIRKVAYLAAFLLAGAAVKAGELDQEFGPKAQGTPSVALNKTDLTAAAPAAVAKVNAAKGTELDDESPDQSCFFRRRWGWGGFGRRGYGFGYPGFGYGLGYGGFGYPGFGYGGFGGLGYGGFGGLGYGGFGYGGYGLGYGLSYASYGLGYGGLGYGGYGFGRLCWW